MPKLVAISLSVIAATTTLMGGLAQPALSLSFGEALGVGAGILLLDKAIGNNQQRYQYRSPQEEYRRGLEDGYNGARYDNPRDSSNYDRGYTQGRQRARAGWRSPFRK
jgi:hypothetical protein